MAYGFVPIVHIVAAVFSIIELGLTGYVVSVFDDSWWNGSPSQVDFLLFCSIWSLLVLAYVGLTPLYYTRLFHKIASLVLLAITTIFWFAGSTALAAGFGAPACHGNRLCGSIEASIAFGFFLFALFAFLTALDAIEVMRSRGHATTTTTHTHNKPHVVV
ncbi:membrane-associating domain-containing protein [Coniochaeta sp. 2T2.1]|nr:membrane-associating domain-containing protein [Coniochaeta sp. 2T2.1]